MMVSSIFILFEIKRVNITTNSPMITNKLLTINLDI